MYAILDTRRENGRAYFNGLHSVLDYKDSSNYPDKNFGAPDDI
jgi:hypothetical protein